MADYSMQDKLILNRTAALCREYRFYESRRDIVQTAGLPPETAKLSISELRQIVDSRIANKVTPPVVGEMLRIESTFRHIRDIHNYNCRQAGDNWTARSPVWTTKTSGLPSAKWNKFTISAVMSIFATN